MPFGFPVDDKKVCSQIVCHENTAFWLINHLWCSARCIQRTNKSCVRGYSHNKFTITSDLVHIIRRKSIKLTSKLKTQPFGAVLPFRISDEWACVVPSSSIPCRNNSKYAQIDDIVRRRVLRLAERRLIRSMSTNEIFSHFMQKPLLMTMADSKLNFTLCWSVYSER